MGYPVTARGGGGGLGVAKCWQGACLLKGSSLAACDASKTGYHVRRLDKHS